MKTDADIASTIRAHRDTLSAIGKIPSLASLISEAIIHRDIHGEFPQHLNSNRLDAISAAIEAIASQAYDVVARTVGEDDSHE